MQDNKLTLVRAVTVASVGGGLEIYDFVIYAFFAPIFAQIFFPQKSDFVSLIQVFSVFAVGYLSRPIGGLIFGHYGDRLGRKQGLLITIILMAIATVFIGVLPSYAVIGIAAPIALVLLRLVQGIAVGGELPGAITFVAEYAENKNRGLLCSLLFFGVNIGLLLASSVSVLITSVTTPEQLITWGWRIAFLLGVVIAFVAYYLRKKIDETPNFQQLQKKHNFSQAPISEALTKSPIAVLIGLGLVCLQAVIISQLFLYMPSYLNKFSHLSLNQALILNSINLLVLNFIIPIMGHASDKFGRKAVILTAALGFIVCSYPLYYLLDADAIGIKVIALTGFSILAAAIVGSVPATLAELFTTRIRYSGVGIAYNTSFAIFAGITPALVILLAYKIHPYAPAYYLIAAACVALIAASVMKEHHLQPLDEI